MINIKKEAVLSSGVILLGLLLDLGRGGDSSAS